MPNFVENPYSGNTDETCSVSFTAQQQVVGSVDSAQTEAQYHKSKLLGEWGVIKAKMAQGELSTGTKIMVIEHPKFNAVVTVAGPDKVSIKRTSKVTGTSITTSVNADEFQFSWLTLSQTKFSIPQAVKPTTATKPKQLVSFDDWKNFDVQTKADNPAPGAVVAEDAGGNVRLVFLGKYNGYQVQKKSSPVDGPAQWLKEGQDVESATTVAVLYPEYNWIAKNQSTPGVPGTKPKPLVASLMGADPGYKVSLSFANSTLKELVQSGKLPPDTVALENPTEGLRIRWTGNSWVVEMKDDSEDPPLWNRVGYSPYTPTGAISQMEDDLGFETANDWRVPTGSPPSPPPQAAAPTPKPAVAQNSTSTGSMSDEDVATLFVQIKDQLATEKGLNIKGSNPGLDAEVYQAIADQTGYSPGEVKGKIDQYKSTGKKLSALKKKVLKKGGKPDPKPHGVPTKAAEEVKQAAAEAVQQVAEAKPTTMYTDEDIAAQYVIWKDITVAASNGKWTLYTKSDEMEDLIYTAIKTNTGYTPTQAKNAIANYLASGKKLSQLKKSLIKNGKLKPQADTLKKGKAPTPDAVKKDVDAKAEEQYKPTPAKEDPKPAEAKAAADAGDPIKIPSAMHKAIFDYFKTKGSNSWLSSGPAQNYQAMIEVAAEFQVQGFDLTPLQAIRIIDEEGAKKAGVANDQLFEKSIVEWLTTPEGKTKQKNADAEIAKAKEYAAKKAKIEAEKKKLAEEAAAVAKKLEANQPPLPPDSAQFGAIQPTKAASLQESAAPWTAAEKEALRKYTGAYFNTMNSHLRAGKSIDGSSQLERTIRNAQAGMRPSTEPMLLHRGTGFSQFGLSDINAIWGLTGKTVQDKGFVSTSVGGFPAFGGEVMMEIECPKGTKMAYVDNISLNRGEREMILAAGTKFKVLRVERRVGQYGRVQFIVRLRVVDQP